MTRRGSVRARNVVTKDKDSSKDAPLDVVEIEDCLSVRALAVPSLGATWRSPILSSNAAPPPSPARYPRACFGHFAHRLSPFY